MITLPPVPEAALDSRFDALEAELAKHPQIQLRLNHVFGPGWYMRECFIPAGTFCTTKIHLQEHPFVISLGRVSVRDGLGDKAPEMLGAPYSGVTKPGTRRVIFAHEDTIWSTFHVTDKAAVEEVEQDIIFRHQDHLPFGVNAYGELQEKFFDVLR